MKLRTSHQRLLHARPRILLAALLFYLITQIINLISWVSLFASQDDMTLPGVEAYITFACFGLVTFVFICSPLLYMPYAYGNEMSPVARKNAACIAITICFLTHDFPLAWIEIWLVWQYGWMSALQGVSCVSVMICFAVGFVTTWISYTWKLSKLLQIRFGGAAPSYPTISVAAVSRSAAAHRI